MKQRYTSRPSPALSALAAAVGIFMVLFVGVLALFPGSKSVMIPLFFVVWVLVAAGVIAYHWTNATRRGGVPTNIIESEEDAGDVPPRPAADRLQELEDLRARQLISEPEYQAKRQEILREL